MKNSLGNIREMTNFEQPVQLKCSLDKDRIIGIVLITLTIVKSKLIVIINASLLHLESSLEHSLVFITPATC